MLFDKVLKEERSRAGEATHIAHLQERLRKLSLTDPVAAVRSLSELARKIRRADVDIRTRLKLLELLRDRSDTLLPEIESRLSQVTLPLALPLQDAVCTAKKLLRELGLAYSAVVSCASGKWWAGSFESTLRTAVLSGMHVFTRRLSLDYRVYARGSRTAWLEMHRLYRTAREQGFATTQIAAGDSPERLYVRALLLAFADPTKFAPGDLERVGSYVQRHERLAILRDPLRQEHTAEFGTASFLIRPSLASPGKSLLKGAEEPFKAGDLILQCSALVDRLDSQLESLERRIAPAKLGLPKVAELPQYIALLSSLRGLWAAPPKRRYSRTQFHPRADVVVGLMEVWRFVAGAALRRRAEDDTGETDLAASEVSAWTVTNESPEGFSLNYLSFQVGSDASAIQVGEIVGLRPRDSALVHLCIVRRAVCTAPSNIEVGIQIVATHVLPAVITLPATRTRAAQRAVRVILIPRMPRLRNLAALLAPPDCLSIGMEFTLPYRGRQVLMRVTERTEQTGSCEVFTLAPARPAE
ncbi:MAG TPA: hypothetical protein VN277_09110 [Acidiferrobacterales bacterium]|nr:hypothetical protein [Acidiferrobacterales bacterium]